MGKLNIRDECLHGAATHVTGVALSLGYIEDLNCPEAGNTTTLYSSPRYTTPLCATSFARSNLLQTKVLPLDHLIAFVPVFFSSLDPACVASPQLRFSFSPSPGQVQERRGWLLGPCACGADWPKPLGGRGDNQSEEISLQKFNRKQREQ